MSPVPSFQMYKFLSCISAATEMTTTVEASIASPIKNLRKKTDLFQLQKVTDHLNCSFCLLFLQRGSPPL